MERLYNGQMMWRNLNHPERAQILMAVLNQMSLLSSPITMNYFNANRPAFMPTASAIATMFGDGLWRAMLERAQNGTLA